MRLLNESHSRSQFIKSHQTIIDFLIDTIQSQKTKSIILRLCLHNEYPVKNEFNQNIHRPIRTQHLTSLTLGYTHLHPTTVAPPSCQAPRPNFQFHLF